MPREITDGEGITGSCIQAFAGLGAVYRDPEDLLRNYEKSLLAA